jgi:hypothetical protein
VACTTRLVDVDVDDLGQFDPDIAPFAEHVPYRWSDLAGREHASRYLIEQRLKKMVVAPVNQRHIHRVTIKPASRRKATEPADDDHAVGTGDLAAGGHLLPRPPLRARTALHDAAIGKDGGSGDVAGPIPSVECRKTDGLTGVRHAPDGDATFTSKAHTLQITELPPKTLDKPFFHSESWGTSVSMSSRPCRPLRLASTVTSTLRRHEVQEITQKWGEPAAAASVIVLLEAWRKNENANEPATSSFPSTSRSNSPPPNSVAGMGGGVNACTHRKWLLGK